MKFEIWPEMTPNLKFDPKLKFFRLEIISRSNWSFWAKNITIRQICDFLKIQLM